MDLMLSQYAVSAARAAAAPTTGRVWLGTTCSGPSAISFSRLAIQSSGVHSHAADREAAFSGLHFHA
ncbi:MAG: hypothetical protein DMG04_02725 [Acidobacteria bacterium]|nr:MAG: hypothetical protein DMG04_02725 [Acidobacteriota bacterium]PYQ80661.1 MAG: hypothetical protein DMG03_22120 [Acidobacteriota bacterium]PYQ84493.1 MAG: hypothetical protein DMG02_31135 [Acidobacteriota bacterium]PYR06901.1 MAG: hypothetical protein DMF99_24610 [Acidobacteriota bacterium]